MLFICGEPHSPNAEGEMVSTVSRSEGVLGLCTCSRALLKQQYLNFFPCALRGKVFKTGNILLKDNRTALKSSFSQAFSHSMHEHLLLEEIMWAAPSGMGQAKSAQRSLLCYGRLSMLAGCSPLGTFSAGTSCEAHPASKSDVVVRAQISIVTVKM